jgi:xanthine dehydrogenase accessory factor
LTQEKKVENNRMLVLVRGVGDVGSAIIWKLLHAGFRVVGHEDRRPKTIRRRMAFSDVICEGESVFEGITAYRIEHLDDFEISADPQRVGIYGQGFEELVATLKPDVIIDSRIQKFTDIKIIRGAII